MDPHPSLVNKPLHWMYSSVDGKSQPTKHGPVYIHVPCSYVSLQIESEYSIVYIFFFFPLPV